MVLKLLLTPSGEDVVAVDFRRFVNILLMVIIRFLSLDFFNFFPILNVKGQRINVEKSDLERRSVD